jgi:hypothetical protein
MSWRLVRFEITQINQKTFDATLYRVTPDLGLHQANLATNGDVYLTHDYLNQLLLNSPSHNKLKSNIDSALGNQWEVELEPYRLALASGMAENISNIG